MSIGLIFPLMAAIAGCPHTHKHIIHTHAPVVVVVPLRRSKSSKQLRLRHNDVRVCVHALFAQVEIDDFGVSCVDISLSDAALMLE